MSDRRPEGLLRPVEAVGSWTYWGPAEEVSPADLVAVVRRGVESGTIKGEEIWRCVRGDGICRTATPTLLAKGEFVGVHVDCGPALVIPVDVGEDR